MNQYRLPWILRRSVLVIGAVLLAFITSALQQAIGWALSGKWDSIQMWQDAIGYAFISVLLVAIIELLNRRRLAHEASLHAWNGVSWALAVHRAIVLRGRRSNESQDETITPTDQLSSLAVKWRQEATTLRATFEDARQERPPAEAIVLLAAMCASETIRATPLEWRANHRMVADATREIRQSGVDIGRANASLLPRLAAEAEVAHELTTAAVLHGMRNRRVNVPRESDSVVAVLAGVDRGLFAEPMQAFAAGVDELKKHSNARADSATEYDVAELFWTFGGPIQSIPGELDALAAWAEFVAAHLKMPDGLRAAPERPAERHE